MGSEDQDEIRPRSLWRKIGLLGPHFPQISQVCVLVRVWACVGLCFVLFFGSLVGVVAIPLLPGHPHDRAPFFGDLFCGHGKCR